MLVQKLFPITEEDVRKTREIYGKSAKDVDYDVSVIRKWLETQPHLPETHDDERLERFILRNKFRIKQTQEKLEAYYTLRGLHIEDFKKMDPTSNYMHETRQCSMWLPMPKLTPKMERVIIWKHMGPDHLFDFENTVLYVMSVLDVQISHDYAVAERLIVDLTNFSFKRMLAITIKNLFKMAKLHQVAFSGRMSGIELLYAPYYSSIGHQIIKAVFKQKLIKKIVFHKDLNSLHQNVPKECLPKEYGGDLNIDLEVIHDDVGNMLLSKRQFLLEQIDRISNESLRVKED